VKLEAFFHLTANFSYLLMIYLSMAMLPSMMIRQQLDRQVMLWIELPMLLLATPAVAVFYLTAQKSSGRHWYHGIRDIPMLMGLGIGLALNNGRAVLEALLGIRSEFKRTPKHGVEDGKDSWMNKRYRGRMDFTLALETGMALYFLFSLYVALRYELHIAIPFLLLFMFGYTYIVLLSLMQGMGSLYRRHRTMRAVVDNEGI
jgi:hypothetical protein